MFLLTIFTMKASWGRYQKLARASDAEHTARIQLVALEVRGAEVSASVVGLSSPRGVEAEVRQRFGVARPGEGEIAIIETEPQATTTPPVPESFFYRLFHTLFVW